MAAISIVGTKAQIPGDFVITNLPLGTETIAAVVGAGAIGIVIDSAVNLSSSHEVDVLVEELRDTLREEVLKKGAI